MLAMERFLLAYDSHCEPCSAFRQVVSFLDARRRIEFVSLEEADSSGLLAGVPVGSRYSSFHLVGPDGRVWSGAEAVLPLTRPLISGGALSAVEKASWLNRGVAFSYSVLSRLHRGCTIRPEG